MAGIMWRAAVAAVSAVSLLALASPAVSRNGDQCLRIRIEATGQEAMWNQQAAAKASAISAWEQAAAAKVPPAYRQWHKARSQNFKSIMISKSTIRYQAAATPCR